MAQAYGRAPTLPGRSHPCRVCGLCKHPRAGLRSIRDRRKAVDHGRVAGHDALTGPAIPATLGRMATTWEYATIPLIIHNTKAVLDQWGSDGWELVQVVTGPDGNGLVAYLKRPTGGQ